MMEEALLEWLSQCSGLDDGRLSALDASDGVRMSEVLHAVDAKHFSGEWLDRIRKDVSDNTRLKATNMKKVLNTVREYMTEVIGLQLEDFSLPDVQRAAEGHQLDVCKMIQLILSCAVNCDAKQGYIEAILKMEPAAQQLIMQAIQEILNLQSNPDAANAAATGVSVHDVRQMIDELKEAHADRDVLKQKCHDLELQVHLLQQEKINITSEFELLHAEVQGKGVGRRKSEADEEDGDAATKTKRQKELKKMWESSQDDLYKLEKERDELHAKVLLLEKQAEESAVRESELKVWADQARGWKDEVDILKETSAKVEQYEAAIESYKKKMEDMADTKRQLKLLEDKNTLLMRDNMDLEDQLKNTGTWKPQVDVYKKNIEEYRSKWQEETKRADKLQFDVKKLLESVEALSVERDRIQTEKDKLKEANMELHDQIKMAEAERGANLLDGHTLLTQDLDPDLHLIPPSVKEKLLRLQRENDKLKKRLMPTGAGGGLHDPGEHNADLLQPLLEDFKQREAKLESKNRQLNQHILELEAALQSAKGSSVTAETNPDLAGALKKISELQDEMEKKEHEKQAMEERYKKYIEKAKAVIRTLDPKQNPSVLSEINILRKQLSEKEFIIENLEHESEKARAVREMEQRLITPAFYSLAMQVHRNSVDQRLSNINSASPDAGPVSSHTSFLAKQRLVQNCKSSPQSVAKSQNAHSSVSSDFLDY